MNARFPKALRAFSNHTRSDRPNRGVHVPTHVCSTFRSRELTTNKGSWRELRHTKLYIFLTLLLFQEPFLPQRSTFTLNQIARQILLLFVSQTTMGSVAVPL